MDEKHKLICAHEVTNDGNDTQQLAPMALKAKEVLEVDALNANADAGYENAVQIKECLDNGITPYVPLSDKNAQVREEGRFERTEFTYHAQSDSYQCPAGNTLKRSGTQKLVLSLSKQKAANCRTNTLRPRVFARRVH